MYVGSFVRYLNLMVANVLPVSGVAWRSQKQ